jgi:hypothetical protein
MRTATVVGSTVLIGLLSAGTFAWAQEEGTGSSGQNQGEDVGKGSSKPMKGEQGSMSKSNTFGLDVTRADEVAKLGKPGTTSPIGIVAFTDRGKETKVEVRVENGTPGQYDLVLDTTGACAWNPGGAMGSGSAGGVEESKPSADTGAAGGEQQQGSSGIDQPSGSAGGEQQGASGSAGSYGGEQGGDKPSTGGQGSAMGGQGAGGSSGAQKQPVLGRLVIDKNGHGQLTTTVSHGSFAGNAHSLEKQAVILKPHGVQSAPSSAACGIIASGALSMR